MAGCDEGGEAESNDVVPSGEKGDNAASGNFERAGEGAANEGIAVRELGDAALYPSDGFAPKNCAYFELRATDDYLGVDSENALHEICLLSTYQQVKHRIITTDVPEEERDYYNRHRAYVDRYTLVSQDGTTLSKTYDISCGGEDCQPLFAANADTLRPIPANIAQVFDGSSDVELSLSGGGSLEIAFFIPRVGSSMIPSGLIEAELPRFGEQDGLLRYKSAENPAVVRMAEIEYVRGQDVSNENAYGFGCEIAHGAQHEAQRFMVRTRELEGQLLDEGEHIEVQEMLNAEYNEDGDPTKGYFSVHVVWSPISDDTPGAEPTEYFHDRIVVPKAQDCEVWSIDPFVERVDPAEIAKAYEEDPQIVPWFEAKEAEVAPE